MKYKTIKLLFGTSLRYQGRFSHVGFEIASQMEAGEIDFVHLLSRHMRVYMCCNIIFMLESSNSIHSRVVSLEVQQGSRTGTVSLREEIYTKLTLFIPDNSITSKLFFLEIQ